MKNVLELIASQLDESGKYIEFKHNSVFSAIELGNGPGIINDISGNIATNLRNEIVKVRGDIIPVWKDYISKVNQILSSQAPTSKLASYKVEIISMPEIANYLASNDMLVNTPVDITLPDRPISFNLPEQIMDYVSFGNTVMDKFMAEVLLSYKSEDIVKIWERYLVNVSKANYYISDLNTSAVSNINDAIVLLAMVKKLKNHRPSYMRIPESEYIAHMDLFATKIKSAIVLSIKNYNFDVEYDKLIKQVSDKTLYVNDKVYQKFLIDNNVDALLGLLLSGEARPRMTLDSVIEGASTWESVWDNANKRESVRIASEQISNYKLVYELALVDLVKELPESLTEEITCNLENIREVLNTLYATYEMPDKLLNIEKVTNKIIGTILFRDSIFYKFTGHMVKYSKINKNLTPDETATMASVDVVTDYLLQQIVIKEGRFNS